MRKPFLPSKDSTLHTIAGRLFINQAPDGAPRALVSRPTAFRIILLFGPAALLLALLRLLQHTALSRLGTEMVPDLLRSNAPPLFFIVLTTLLATVMARAAWPWIRPAWLGAGSVLLGLALTLATRSVVPPWADGWLTAQAFEVLRWDTLVLMGLALLFTLLLESLRGRAQALARGLLHLLLPLLLLLPVVELGCVIALGNPLDWPLLEYSLLHLDELAPVIGSELDRTTGLLLALPFLLSLLPPALAALPPVRRWLAAGTPIPASRPLCRHLAGFALPFMLAFTLPPAAQLPPNHSTISYAGMAQSLLGSTSWEAEALARFAASDEPPFDARNLHLVPAGQTRAMNVVVILLESHRSRSTTPYNPALATTPFLDSLAQHALLVDNMYAVVSYTNKSLIPLLAGVYPELSYYVIEAEPGRLPATGLPRLLQPFGYRSAFFTPAMMVFERKDRVLKNLGFETIRGNASFDRAGFTPANYFGYEDRIMLQPSLDWIDEQTAKDHPFFLTYLTLTSHHAYDTPPSFPRQRYTAQDEELNQYLNALRYTDGFLRDLFAAFKARDLLASTLFVVLGDHGEAFSEHGLRTHGDVIWDEALQIPALLYNPVLFPKGGRIEGLRQHIDVLPTIAEVLGYEISGGMLPGLSLLQPAPPDRILYHSTKDSRNTLALRQDSLKFIYYHHRQPIEVYNFRSDPLERRNIADAIAPERFKTVELHLLLWRAGIQDIYHDQAQQTVRTAAR